MKKLTKKVVVERYILWAKGDLRKALEQSVEDMGKIGLQLSSGFVRAVPYSKVQAPHEAPPSVDIPEPDDDE